jgi:hypothetical protein
MEGKATVNLPDEAAVVKEANAVFEKLLKV